MKEVEVYRILSLFVLVLVLIASSIYLIKRGS